MASYYWEAGEAIGRVIGDPRWYPEDAANWGNIVPSAKWQMDVPTWDQMRGEMLDRFAALIEPCRIRPGENFPNSRVKELYILQRRMADSVQCPDDEEA